MPSMLLINLKFQNYRIFFFFKVIKGQLQNLKTILIISMTLLQSTADKAKYNTGREGGAGGSGVQQKYKI